MKYRVLAGPVVVSVGLWLFDLMRLSGFAFAGVTDEAARSRVLAEARPALASLELKLFLLHVAVGLALGLLLHASLRGRLRGFLVSSAITFAVFVLALFGMIGRYPQLFSDRFWLEGGTLAWLQRFATHSIGPRFFDFALVFTIAGIALSRGRLLLRARPAAFWRAAVTASLLLIVLFVFRGPGLSSARESGAPSNVLILALDSLRTDRIEDPEVMPKTSARIPLGSLFRYASRPLREPTRPGCRF